MLEVSDLVKKFGGITAVDHASLEVREHEIHAVIGPNGAGKTTLVSQLAGELRADGGRTRFRGEDITSLRPAQRAHRGLARSFQITNVMLPMTLLENVALAVQAQSGHSFRFWQPVSRETETLDKAMEALKVVGLDDRADRVASEVSHGEHRQLEVAMALAMEPVMLLLDEPMAGMGPEETTTMVGILEKLKGDKTILLVEHDMDAVFSLADRISVLVYGQVIATGNREEIQGNRDVQVAYLGDMVE
ncbi:MAG: ABC transporter ATP-binding protein [Gammaproteobacteria bacterium]|nr:ABC transporter ATP-binding protein [Gammaproteobacteria bacterium]